MKIKAGYVLREVAGMSVVFPVTATPGSFEGLLRLNQSGKMLFEKLSLGATKEELIETLCTAYDITKEQAETDTTDFLTRLSLASVLE